MTSEHRGRRLLKGGGDDEDIPTTTTTSPTLHDEQANQIRLGPVTRSRAKLLEQQLNLLLLESDDRLSENYILPKSLCVCMIRYQGEDKELGGAEVQGEEAKEQGQATWEEEPQEDKARRNKASGRGTTALNAVLPRHGTTALATVLPRPGTTVPTTAHATSATEDLRYYRNYYREATE